MLYLKFKLYFDKICPYMIFDYIIKYQIILVFAVNYTANWGILYVYRVVYLQKFYFVKSKQIHTVKNNKH